MVVDLLDRLADLLLAAAISGGQLPDRSVHVGLAPEQAGAVVEEVEAVGVVAFELDQLELDVLVVEIGVEGGGARDGQPEPAGEEEARDLPGTQVVAQLEAGLGVFVSLDVLGGVEPAF